MRRKGRSEPQYRLPVRRALYCDHKRTGGSLHSMILTKKGTIHTNELCWLVLILE